MNAYTLADLIKLTGAKRRSLLFWSDAGVLQAQRGTDRSGKGVHRRYSREEAVVAAILSGFADMTIGMLRSVAQAVRRFVQAHRAEVERAINNECYELLILTTWGEEEEYSAYFETAPMEQNSKVRIPWLTGVGPLDNLHYPNSRAHVILLNTYLSGFR